MSIEIGKELWSGLHATFLEIADLNGLKTPDERTAMWAGFLSCCAGSMAADQGSATTSMIIGELRNITVKLAREGLAEVPK
jgi:hypothetical protein